MSEHLDPALSKKLIILQEDFEKDQDTVAAWEAIRLISAHNQKQAGAGLVTYPFPDWIKLYLANCSDRICRLQIGIDPSDNRSISEMGFENVGRLRKVPQKDGKNSARFRDERASYIGQALELVVSGWTAFQKRDQILQDRMLIEMHDDASLEDYPEMKRTVQNSIKLLLESQGNITPATAKNRLSLARSRRRVRHET